MKSQNSSSFFTRVKNRVRHGYFAWLLMSPAFLYLTVIGLIPFFYVIALSFMDYSLAYVYLPRVFVGLKNFRTLVFDEFLWHALRITFTYTTLAVGLELLIGLILAILTTRNIKGKAIWRSLLLVPMVVSPIVVGLIWLQMLNPDFGVIAYFLHELGLFVGTGPTIETSTALLTTVLMDVWHWTPFVMLILGAGILSLPVEPYEAAIVDGASSWQVFRHVTLPLLTPVITVVLLLRTMDALRIFDEVWILTGGGPGSVTRYSVIHAYRISLAQFNIGYGAAISLFLFFITLVLCSFFFNLLRGRR